MTAAVLPRFPVPEQGLALSPGGLLFALAICCFVLTVLALPARDAHAGISVRPAPACSPCAAASRLGAVDRATLPARFATVERCTVAKDGPRTHAVLVGIDKPKGWPALAGPSNELRLVDAALRRLEPKVQPALLFEPTTAQVLSAYDKLLTTVACGDRVYLQWSGVAWADEAADCGAEVWLLTRDTGPVCQAPSEPVIGESLLRAFVHALRARGADVFLVVDTNFSGRMDLLGSGGAKATSMTRDGVWRYRPSWEETAATVARLPRWAGDATVFLSSEGEAQEKHVRFDGKDVTFGTFTFALVGALSGETVPTSRVLAERVAATESLRQFHKAHARSHAPVFESTNPDLTFLRLAETANRGGRRIELVEPAPSRGAEPLLVQADTTRVLARVVPGGGLRSAEVNGQEATLVGDGLFAAEVRLQPGHNDLRVVAAFGPADIAQGRFQVHRMTGDTPILTGQTYLLSIGIQRYDLDKTGFAPLATPHADARAMAKLLSDRFGARTLLDVGGQAHSLLLLDPSRDEILATLEDLGNTLTPEDRVVVFYAGHGDHPKGLDEAYWVPVDARARSVRTYISAHDITTQLKQMPARHVLVISDSCYAGAMATRSGAQVAAAPADPKQQLKYLLKLHGSRSRRAITSGGDKPVQDGGGGEHSVFAKVLLEELTRAADSRRAVTALDLYARIRERVAGRAADQVPREFVLPNSGHDDGEFVFWPGAGPIVR